jgi:hypothetical protein
MIFCGIIPRFGFDFAILIEPLFSSFIIDLMDSIVTVLFLLADDIALLASAYVIFN